ncbi:MAG: MBL fold metallo-hydrolase [Anaerolineae bacterium]
MSQTKLVLLGTGTPNILPTRYQTSAGVLVDDVPYLVDCGGGTLQRIAQAHHEKGITGFAFENLSRIFLTHLHPDHVTGLADLIIAPWVLDRTDPLQIWGPTGTRAMIAHLLQAYEIGIGEHRDGLAPINHPLDVLVTEISAGQVYHDERVTVTAFPVQHGGLEAYGYQFISDDRVIVFSGDTTPSQALVDHARECDVLVHEVYSAQGFAQRSPEWQAYHHNAHTSTRELAEIAREVQPKLLVLVHQLFWGQSEEDLLAEIREQYHGEVISGQDLDVF